MCDIGRAFFCTLIGRYIVILHGVFKKTVLVKSNLLRIK